MRPRFLHFAALSLLATADLHAAAPTPEQIEFFESRIRPVLAQDCYECHSTAGKKKGGLLLDSRAGWQKGGDSGDVIVPGKPGESLLLRTIRHQEPDLKMPKSGAKLEDRVVQDFEKWIAMGAPDPRDAPPSPELVAQDRDWKAVLERRKGWWSFQPVQKPAPPAATAWSAQPVDRFLEQAMSAKGLAPAADAEPRTILRRLSYVLTGLAPTPEETAQFERAAAANLDSAIAAAADRLLASPRFGEQWARHWMDWVRYADSHGSEGDPLIPYAWRYRDYLIRALNEDIPYSVLVEEAIAGDIQPLARFNRRLGIFENALGPAHFRLVQHGFTPTDALDEQVTFTDNQIDTISKTFLGLTVSCARCHNHKFDPISQTDFYALYGIMASCRPALIDVDSPEKKDHVFSEMLRLKLQIREQLGKAWLAAVDEAMKRLRSWKPPGDPKQKEFLLMGGQAPISAWVRLRELPPEKWMGEWQRERVASDAAAARLADLRGRLVLLTAERNDQIDQTWIRSGPGLARTVAGEIRLLRDGERIVADVFPSGTYSGLLSDRQSGIFASPRFASQGGRLWLRLRGDGKARARYVVQNYPRTGTIYFREDLEGGLDHWVSWDIDYWKGDQLYLELTTESDQPVETKNVERSWFGIEEAYVTTDKTAPPPPLPGAPLAALVGDKTPAPHNEEELLGLYGQALRNVVEKFATFASETASDRVSFFEPMTNAETEFLAQFVRLDLLPNTIAELPKVAPIVARYRELEAQVPVPRRAPGLLEGNSFDQPLLVRGDHKKPGEPVPRRFLEALDPRPFSPGGHQSGRFELAERITSPANPLTYRVMVNRLWQYVYGRGIVATPDNFGRLGEQPTHPELLDYLAGQFAKGEGSMKQMLRTLVTARAFRTVSLASAEAQTSDPENRLLSHFSTRRLDAESIRDAMLSLSGKMEVPTPGDEVPPGREGVRRSVYMPVIRNRLDPLLMAFDFPVPSATRGRRDSTNVPAQALALLNAPQVVGWAAQWADRPRLGLPPDNVDARIQAMFTEAFGRAPSPQELSESRDFLGAPNLNWHALAEALLNVKEFIYLY